MRLFGQLEVADGGVAFAVRGAKQRALLALLALHRGEPVSADRLIDALWGDGQAANPVNALQAQIGQLRRTLGAGAIVTTEAGYALAVGPGEVDVVRFEQLVAKGRRLVGAGRDGPGVCHAGRGARPAAGRAAGRVRLRRLRGHRTGAAGRADPGGHRNPGRSGPGAGPARGACWRAGGAVPGAPTPRAPLGTAHPRALPGRTAGRRPARLHRSPRPPGRRAGHRPRAAVAGTSGPHPGAGLLARRSQPGSGPGGRAGSVSRQSAGAAEQLHRPRRRAGTAARGGPLQPARDTDRPRRDGQDQPRGRGRGRPARRIPRWCLARRAGRRRRARRGGAGRGQRPRGGRVCPRRPAACGIGSGAHRRVTWPDGRWSLSSTTASTSSARRPRWPTPSPGRCRACG